MASKEMSHIGGTVIQRSFVPRGLGTVLSIATVPLSEMYPSSKFSHTKIPDRLLTDVTSEILGIPRETIIDDDQYRQLARFLRDPDFPRRFRLGRRSIPWHILYEDYLEFLSDLPESRRRPSDESTRGQFSTDALCLLASSSPDWSVYGFPILGYPAARHFLDHPDLRELGLSSEAFRAGISCFFSGLAAEPKVVDAVSEIQQYDIPTGQSPRATSDSLLKLIDTGKKMCLAPMVTAGALGITQLGQGSYVTALLTVGTGSAMTLVLVGTLAVSDLLVRRMISIRSGAPEQ